MIDIILQDTHFDVEHILQQRQVTLILYAHIMVWPPSINPSVHPLSSSLPDENFSNDNHEPIWMKFGQWLDISMTKAKSMMGGIHAH